MGVTLGIYAYYMQRNGLTIIPNAGWSDAESLEWAFDGLPSNSYYYEGYTSFKTGDVK